MTETNSDVHVEPDNAIAKAITLLNALRVREEGGSARELAVLTGIPRSTVQRILTTLTDSGMMAQDPADQRYHIGPHALWIGLGYKQSINLVNLARPLMVGLRNLTDETVSLSIAVGGTRVFVEEVQSRSELRFASELGRLFPLWSGASGRVLMSGLGDAEIDEILLDDTHRAEVDNPLPIAENREAILKIREDGYATAVSESITHSSSIAVPVMDAGGRIIAALSVSGPEGRLTLDRMNAVLPLLRDSSHQLSLLLGAARGDLVG